MTFTLVKSVGQGHNCEENGRREDYYFLFFFLMMGTPLEHSIATFLSSQQNHR